MYQRKTPHGSARLYEYTDPQTGEVTQRLRITLTSSKGKPRSTEYTVTDLEPHRDVAWPAYRLTKIDLSEAYDIADFPHGPTCTCPDFIWARERTGDLCKHLRAAVAVSLLHALTRDESPVE